MSIAGRHIVISGGGSGVGADMAAALAADGARVTILGRDEKKLAAQGLPYRRCDVTSPAAVARAFRAARAEQGPVWAVIANAGAARSKPFKRMYAKDFTEALDVNAAGVFNVWQAGLSDMKNGGRLLVVASTAGLKGYPYVSGYVAAKHAAVGLTRALALELATSGVTVNAICPGFIETPMLHDSIRNITQTTGMTEEKAASALRRNNPQDRFIQTEEITAAARYLLSDAARGVNGHTLTISGGEI